MFENISHFFRRIVKPEQKELGSKDAAKERLHLVLMQDRANVSADFLELMKQEIIDVIKKYIVVDESSIDVRLTNKSNDDGTNGAPALYANIPIVNIKNDMMAEKVKEFEGVDFNKEMGITPFTEDVIEEIEEKDDIEIEPIPGQEIEQNKTTIIQNIEELELSVEKELEDIIDVEDIEDSINDVENENNIDNEEIDDEEIDDEELDDDVTFDDLLKAAEEEEKSKQIKDEKEDENGISKVDINEEELNNIEISKNEIIEEKKKEKKTRGRKKKKTSE